MKPFPQGKIALGWGTAMKRPFFLLLCISAACAQVGNNNGAGDYVGTGGTEAGGTDAGGTDAGGTDAGGTEQGGSDSGKAGQEGKAGQSGSVGGGQTEGGAGGNTAGSDQAGNSAAGSAQAGNEQGGQAGSSAAGAEQGGQPQAGQGGEAGAAGAEATGGSSSGAGQGGSLPAGSGGTGGSQSGSGGSDAGSGGSAGASTCALPSNACATGSEVAEKCSNARVLGRKSAGTTGIKVKGNTCGAKDDHDEDDNDCWDAGADQYFRVFMRKGETLQTKLVTGEACIGGSWQATLALFAAAPCTDTSCATKLLCNDLKYSTQLAHTAAEDGWYTILVDGSTAFDDEGDYTLDVALVCLTPDCEC